MLILMVRDDHISVDAGAAGREETDPVALRDSQDRFIAAWAQMGAQWGIPRSMAEVHALLYITGDPMNTDEVMDRLGVSRGNASMTLRNLVDWGIVHRVHQRGDRKEYFQAEQDVWKLCRTIIRERKKREIDPLMESLRDCRETTTDLDENTATIASHNQRLDEMLFIIELIETLSDRFISPSGEGLEAAARLLEPTD